ncbi:MAG: class I SAM-dependent methyltransferase [Steroidobacteraceae bacterium]
MRYAHARASALGHAVHFRQADAEHTPYGDGQFDLVVSHILLHEVSATALQAIFTECHRLLAPGGVMLHIDVPVRNRDLDAFDQFLADWETWNNNEPFWRGLHALDLAAAAQRAGFPRENLLDEYFDAGHRAFINSRRWWAFAARRAGEGGARTAPARAPGCAARLPRRRAVGAPAVDGARARRRGHGAVGGTRHGARAAGRRRPRAAQRVRAVRAGRRHGRRRAARRRALIGRMLRIVHEDLDGPAGERRRREYAALIERVSR